MAVSRQRNLLQYSFIKNTGQAKFWAGQSTRMHGGDLEEWLLRRAGFRFRKVVKKSLGGFWILFPGYDSGRGLI
jgi:hypothetical protein